MSILGIGLCWLGHNVSQLTRPNCFPPDFSRLKRFSKIHLAVFPEAKLFPGQNFRVKNEIQNSISEFATGYGMLAGNHCGDLTDMMPATGTGTGTGSLAPSGHRPATATGCRLGLPAARPRVAATDHRQRTAPRTGTGTAKHQPRWRRGKAPARLRPELNKKPATREGSRQWKAAGS